VKAYYLLKDIVKGYPETYVLPEDTEEFEKHKSDHPLWVLKEEMIDRGGYGTN
jgi:hypothetical protein